MSMTTPASISPPNATQYPPASSRTKQDRENDHSDNPRPIDAEHSDVEQGNTDHPLHWSQTEVQEIPYNNMKLVVPALLLVAFLSALDQTVVAVALPEIVKDIGGESGYAWVGAAYMLMSACCNPLYGRLSDIIGRKPILFFSITTFLLGSALCGAAQNFIWLAFCRGVQGVGAGGNIQMVFIVIADITTLQERPKYGGYFGATWGIASILGPVVGGVLTDRASWRWCFWINLPTGCVALAILLACLHVNPEKKRTISEVLSNFDFVGLFLLTAGILLFLFGLEDAASTSEGWRSAETLAPLIVGIVLLVFGVVNETVTTKQQIVPPRLFRTRTTTACLIGSFIHTFVFFSTSYYIPLYLEMLGSNAMMAGIRLLPLSIGGSLISIVTGMFMSKTGHYRFILWAGAAIMTLGCGLLTMLDNNTSTAKQELWLLVVGIGVGLLFQAPMLVTQAAMPLKDMATSTTTVGLLRTLGGTVGVAVGNSIFQSEVSRRLAKIPGLSASLGSGAIDYTSVSEIQPASLRQQVSHAFARSIATIFLVSTPISFVAFLLFLIVKKYSLTRNVHREGRPSTGTAAAGATTDATDVEKSSDTPVPS